MKISVCIPVYNFDVRELVFSLSKEIENHKLNAEIILIDDASSKDFITINEPLKDVVNQFILLEKNIGRSSIRNLFLKYASGDFLLFLDCDAKIISENFLQNYIDFISKNANSTVIFGGRIPNDSVPPQKYILRWNYSKFRESQRNEIRKKNPYLSFQSNNFLIKRQLFEIHKFNEDLKQYGYEDLIFSLQLKEKNIHINHIENTITNKDLESNCIFLTKSEEAAKNLSFLYKSTNYKDLISEIKLIKFYKTLKKYRLDKIFSLFFKINKFFLKYILIHKNVSLKFLDIYKLGLFIENVNV